MGDRVSVTSQSVYGSWSVALDLDARVVTVHAGRELVLRERVSAAELREVRALAAPLLAYGDRREQSQFANGEETFEVELGGRAVTWSFIDESGGGAYEARPLWEWATRRLHAAKSDSEPESGSKS